jgi:hypothetical protein
MEPPKGTPVLVVLGIDPEKHEIPPLLKHHLVKMQKDFLISFIGKDDIGYDTGHALQDMLKQSGFEPVAKSKLVSLKSKLETAPSTISTSTEFCPRCQNNVSVTKIETTTSITKTCQTCGTTLSNQTKI